MNGSENQAAAFIRLAREDDSIREALKGLIGGCLEAEISVLQKSVALGKAHGFEFDVAQLSAALESEFGLAEIQTTEAHAVMACHSRSGCRTPCMYCEACGV